MEILFFREDAPCEEEMNRLHEVYGADVEVTWLRPLWVDDAVPVGDPRIFAEDSRIYTDTNVRKLVEYMRERGCDEVVIDHFAVRTAEVLCLSGINPLWSRTVMEGEKWYEFHRIRSVTIEEKHLTASDEEAERVEKGEQLIDGLCNDLVEGGFSSGETHRALRAVRHLLRLPQ